MITLSTNIRILQAGSLRKDPDWVWDFKGGEKDSFVYWFVTDGHGTLKIAHTTHELYRGSCIISSLRSSHTGRQDPCDLFSISWMLFQFVGQNGEAFLPSPLPPVHRRMEAVSFMEQLGNRVISLFKATSEKGLKNNKRRAEHWAKTVLMEVQRFDAQPAYSGNDRKLFHLVSRLADDMQRNPGSCWSPSILGKKLHCSPDYCIRLFKKFLDITPGELLQQYRIDHARHMLRFSSYSIGDIAEILGYSDIFHFSKQFKKRLGKSPSAYRRTDFSSTP